MVSFVLKESVDISWLVHHSQGHSIWHLSKKLPLLRHAGRYNPETCTFFTPYGKIGFTLHEMYEVSSLPMEIYHMKSIFPAWKTAFDEDRCHAGVRDLLGSVLPLSHLFPDHQIKGWGRKTDFLGELFISGLRRHDRPSVSISCQH